MKKKFMIIVTMLLFISILCNATPVSAKPRMGKSSTSYRQAVFVGTITANKTFYKGESFSKKDFDVDGVFIDAKTMRPIQPKKWKMFFATDASGDSVVIRFLYLAPYNYKTNYDDITYEVEIEVVNGKKIIEIE